MSFNHEEYCNFFVECFISSRNDKFSLIKENDIQYIKDHLLDSNNEEYSESYFDQILDESDPYIENESSF